MKKFSKLDFELWGKEVSEGYLQKLVPMNDAIVKIADDNSLNVEQINRIVEEANVQTYLQLHHTKTASKDKYVEFKVADAKEVAKKRSCNMKVASVDDVSDYTTRPKESFSCGFISLTPKMKEVPDDLRDSEKTAMIGVARGIEDQFKHKMYALSTRFSENVAKLKDYKKTAALSRELDAYIKYKIEPNSIQEKLARQIVAELSPTTEKEAQIINDSSPIFKLLRETIDIGREYSDNYNTGPDVEKLINLGRRSEKTAAFTSKLASTLWKILAGAGLVGIPAVTAYRAGVRKGERAQEIRMSPLNSLPPNYNPKGV